MQALCADVALNFLPMSLCMQSRSVLLISVQSKGSIKNVPKFIVINSYNLPSRLQPFNQANAYKIYKASITEMTDIDCVNNNEDFYFSTKKEPVTEFRL